MSDSARGGDAAPVAPDWVQAREYALEKWNELWPELDRVRVTPERDADLVASYCHIFADMRDCMLALARFGRIIRTGRGRVYENPAGPLFDDCVKRMVELRTVLGIRPDEPMARAVNWKDYAEILREEV